MNEKSYLQVCIKIDWQALKLNQKNESDILGIVLPHISLICGCS